MEKEEIVNIPFVASESQCNRLERMNTRIVRALVISIIINFLMFAGIMIYFYLPTEIIEDSIQNVSDIDTIENSSINNG